jgi:urease subunit beta
MSAKLSPFAQFAADNAARAAAADGRPRHPTDDSGRDDDRTSSEVPLDAAADPLVPGEILHGEGDVVINEGMELTTVRVANTSDRPIQVGSHYHFAEVNPALEFDRAAAWGKRLAVLSGGAERFEPGAVLEVDLVPIKGSRVVLGLRGECRGELDAKG